MWRVRPTTLTFRRKPRTDHKGGEYRPLTEMTARPGTSNPPGHRATGLAM